MTTAQWLGNGVSLITMAVLIVSSFRRDKRRILIDQTVNYVLFLIADIILKGYSGAVQDALSALRHILVLLGKHNRALNGFFIAAFVALGLVFNNMGFVGLLPIAASVEYTVVVMRPNVSTAILKYSMAFCMLCWAVYAFCIGNYVNVISNVITMASSLVAVYRDRKFIKNDAGCLPPAP